LAQNFEIISNLKEKKVYVSRGKRKDEREEKVIKRKERRRKEEINFQLHA
jgi:hypothetical protein